MVCARSGAEMPVLTFSVASTDTVKAGSKAAPVLILWDHHRVFASDQALHLA